MTERQNIRVAVHQQSVYGSIVDEGKYEPDTIKSLIEWLGEMLTQVPSGYRDSAKFEIESVGGYEGEHHSEIAIFYDRPETDEEMSTRVARMRQRAEEELHCHERYAEQARTRLQRLAP